MFRDILQEHDYPFLGLSMKVTGNIPVSRGLGSSASCILAGVIAADHYMNAQMTKDEIYKKAVEIEGHCDNITSQYFGGLTASFLEDGKIYYQKFDIPKKITCCALIPDFELSTKKARAVLPDRIDRKDSIYNSAHMLFLLEALRNGAFDQLKYFLRDKLHEDYRKDLIPNFDTIINEAYRLGAYGAFLSGAGPTIMVLCPDDDFSKNLEPLLKTFDVHWEIRNLLLDNDGIIESE